MSSVWTRRMLSRSSSDYLRGLPLELRATFDGLPAYFVHGSPDDRLWEYVDPRTHADLFGYYLERVGARVMGLGHTHIPFVWEEGPRVVFNPGSVGQPRDGDWRASYAIVAIDEGACSVAVRRVRYDVDGAARRILDAGLPEFFAERLHTGT
jgi:diadenosine tetraphosphatase ApaH/serine/threonine PP2A family protein phosphatase